MSTDGNKTCGIASIALASLNGLGLIAGTVGFLVQRPKVTALYAEMGTALPVATQVVLSIPGPVVLLLTLFFLALLIAKEFIPKKVIPLALNLAWLAVAIVVSVASYLALLAPLITIIQRL